MDIKFVLQPSYGQKVTSTQLNTLLLTMGFKSIQDKVGKYSIEQDGEIWGLCDNDSNTFLFFTDIP